MKILQITTFFHPVSGGVEIHVQNLAQELIRQGHEVEVLASDSNKGGPRFREKLSTYLGIKIVRFRTWFSFSYFHKFYPGLLFYLLREEYDVVHVHGFRKLETYIALIATTLRRKQLVLTTHNPFPVSSRPSWHKPLLWIYDHTVGFVMARRIGKVIALVDSEKPILQKQFAVAPEKIIVIPNGLEDSFYEQSGDALRFYREWGIEPTRWRGICFFVGRINHVKGLDNLKDAVDSLPNVLFFFAGGDDGALDYLHTLYEGNENVIFTNRVISREKVKDALAAADIFVFPSHHEAFGIVLLEALASHTAIVSTNQGGPSEFLDDSEAILIEPTDQKKWTSAIESLLSSPKKRELLAKNAFKKAEDYRWSKLAVKIAKIYKQLLSK